jgi:hypothetical protein
MSGLDRTFTHVINGLSFVAASTRGSGAVRYQCPESGSYVLLTDATELKHLSRRAVRCAGCGGEHRLLRVDEPLIESAA